MEVALKIPEKIKIVVSAGDCPREGMFAFLKFVMARNNSFDLLFGPSDEGGGIEVTRDQVLNEARKSMELFVMDYVDIESHWTGKLQVTPMNRDAVTRALSAYRSFRRYEYPPDYEKTLQAADAALSRVSQLRLAAAVQCDTLEPVEVESIAVSAS